MTASDILTQELEATATLLEQASVPGKEAARTRLEARLASDMAAYFKALADAVPWDEIEVLYYRHVKQD